MLRVIVNGEEETTITNEDFPIGKVAETGDTVTADTIAVSIYDLDNLDNFSTINTFEGAQEESYVYPVLILRDSGEATKDYMQGWVDNNFFH